MNDFPRPAATDLRTATKGEIIAEVIALRLHVGQLYMQMKEFMAHSELPDAAEQRLTNVEVALGFWQEYHYRLKKVEEALERLERKGLL